MMCGTCEYNDVCPDAFTRASDYCSGPEDELSERSGIEEQDKD